MKAVTYIYVAVYVMFSAWVIVNDIKDKDPLWDIAADTLLLPLGFIGMLLFQFEVTNPSIKSAWKVVAVLIIAGQLFNNIFSRYLLLRGHTNLDPEDIPEWGILLADLTAVVVLVPMFVMNAMFAFS